MTCNNFIKNITSKDFSLSQNATKELINSKDLSLFECLCEKSEFIFPFIREKIIKNFVNLLNKENLNKIFEFSKIYSYDFEDLIVKSWLKFACEDLTDEILDLFENGTMEQKAYCAKYFSKINDSLSLELLKKYAFCDCEPLRINCAIALCAFGDLDIVDEAKKIIEESDDDFKKLNALQFLIAYGNKDLIEYIVKNAFNSPFASEIFAELKNCFSLEDLKEKLSVEDLSRIFSVFIENYPENITLDTLIQYEIIGFIKFLTQSENYNRFIENILITAKAKFSEYYENDIYTFDLDKDNKNELKNIIELLNGFDFELKDFDSELKYYNTLSYRFIAALNVICAMKLNEYSSHIAQLINSNLLNNTLICQCAQTLKNLDNQNLIEKDKIEQIEDDNIRMFVLSLL